MKDANGAAVVRGGAPRIEGTLRGWADIILPVKHWQKHDDAWWRTAKGHDAEEWSIIETLKRAEALGLIDGSAGCADESAAVELLWGI